MCEVLLFIAEDTCKCIHWKERTEKKKKKELKKERRKEGAKEKGMEGWRETGGESIYCHLAWLTKWHFFCIIKLGFANHEKYVCLFGYLL